MKLTVEGPAKRYAKAFFETAVEGKNADIISAEVVMLYTTITSSIELQKFLSQANINNTEKANALAIIAKSMKLTTTTANFMQLLAIKGRAKILGNVLAWYGEYKRMADGEINACVTSATPISATQRKNIEKFVASKTKKAKKVQLEEEIDPSLVAGIKVRIGSVEYDTSTRGHINSLRASLTK